MTELQTPTIPTENTTAVIDLETPNRVAEHSIPSDDKVGTLVEKSDTPPIELKKTNAMFRWLLAARCGVAIHSRRWRYIAQGNCRQSSTCTDCNRAFSRSKHSHNWQYPIKDDCTQKQVCDRCANVRNTRINHQEYGDSYHIDEDTDGRKCVRCGDEKTWGLSDPD